MRSLTARTAQICLFFVAVAVALPAAAGGTRSKSTVHHGHAVEHHGVASFHRNSRGLADGVNIFNRRSHAQHAHASKPAKHKRAGKVRAKHKRAGKALGNAKHRAKSRGKIKKHKHTRKDKDRRGKKKFSKRKHKGHHKRHKGHHANRVIYASSVYVLRPTDEYIASEFGDDQDCRYLTERGYDLSGRRVLVEWTLCFDEQGEAYVPENGRRIVARY